MCDFDSQVRGGGGITRLFVASFCIRILCIKTLGAAGAEGRCRMIVRPANGTRLSMRKMSCEVRRMILKQSFFDFRMNCTCLLEMLLCFNEVRTAVVESVLGGAQLLASVIERRRLAVERTQVSSSFVQLCALQMGGLGGLKGYSCCNFVAREGVECRLGLLGRGRPLKRCPFRRRRCRFQILSCFEFELVGAEGLQGGLLFVDFRRLLQKGCKRGSRSRPPCASFAFNRSAA